jgi:exodeoxyribonuclease V beta subunit
MPPKAARPPKKLEPFAVPLVGTVLVEASAGTGKTHAITTLFLRLVIEQGVPVQEILVVTFTEAATAELRDRIRGRLRAALELLSGGTSASDPELVAFAAKHAAERSLHRSRATTALRDLDLAAISTIHAFCMRMLREHAFESGARLDLSLLTDPAPLIRDVADDYWASSMYGLDSAMYRLAETGLDLPKARKIVSALARRPSDLPVLPARAPADVAALRAAADAAFRAAHACWDAAAIPALLLRAGLNGNKYRADQIPGWCAQVAGYLADEAPAYVAPRCLAKLTVTSLAGGTNAGRATPAHPFFRAAEALVEALRTLYDGFVVQGLLRGAVDHVRRELPRRKEALRVQSFDDLLSALDAALRGPRARALKARIAGRFRAALIDEFQDTDPVQYRIFDSLFRDGVLLLVGDPKQSIYAFRGADVFSYMAGVDAAAARYTLGENRRSDPSLVEAVNTIFARAKEPFFFDKIGFHPVVAHAKEDRLALGRGGAALELLFVEREEGQKTIAKDDLPGMVAREISRFLASGAKVEGRAVVAGDIAVLTRSNRQARLVQAELRQLKIPTALSGDESVFESEEAAEVELLLRAVLEPTRAGAVRAALATAVAGLSADELVGLESDEAAWDGRCEAFRSWSTHWSEHGFIHAYRRMLTELGAEARLLALVDGERRMTNLLHLGELLHGAASRERLAPSALVRWLGLMRADQQLTKELGSEASEVRLESDAHAVKLLTIHKSKGLEYPIVYCPSLWEQRLPAVADVAIAFHDPARDLALTIDVNPGKDCASLTAAIHECRAEDQRLLYVALTRAKHRCVIVWGRTPGGKTCSLAYTLHQPPTPSPTTSLAEAVSARFKELTDAELMSDLAALVAASGGTIAVRRFEDGPAARYVDAAPRTGELQARRFERARVDTWFRVGSFSALASGRRAPSTPEKEGKDRDEADEASPDAAGAALPPAEPVILHAFPRGTKAGTMLHALLEDHDFTSPDHAALRALASDKLAASGYPSEAWSDVLAAGVRAMLDTPLDDAGLALSRVPRARRIDELEFVFPVARQRKVLTAAALAGAFAAHASPAVPASYAARVRGLGFLPLEGFLKGYIDLVFEHEGRFYVVDYKSNHLGDAPTDYALPKLVEAMMEHDYFLQYHLYALAVHRWLEQRKRGYDYDAHFGGVLYLFARGMSPGHAPGTGVFRDRPSRALIGALSEAADG